MGNHEALGQIFHHKPHLVPLWFYVRENGSYFDDAV